MFAQAVGLYRNAYAGLSRSTWWLALVMVINRSGTMVVPFMTMYMTQYIGVGIAKAAFVMSIFGAGSIVGALLGGKITDKLGYYYVQLVTLCSGGIMFIVLGQMKTYPTICVAAFFLSMLNEAFRPANSVAIVHYSSPQNRTRSYSLNRLAVNMGWAVGGTLGGIIAAHDYRLLFWVDGLTNIFAAVLLYAVLAPSKNLATSQKKTVTTKATRSAYQDYGFLFFVFLQIIFATCFFQTFSILPVYYKTVLHLSETFIGINMALNGLIIGLVEMVIVFKLEGRRPYLQYISMGVLLVGVSFMLLNNSVVTGSILALGCMVVITIGEIFSMPFMNSYWIKRTSDENRGQYAALFTVAWSCAQIIGPSFGGQVVEKIGYAYLWWMNGAACLLLSVAYFMMGKLQQRR